MDIEEVRIWGIKVKEIEVCSFWKRKEIGSLEIFRVWVIFFLRRRNFSILSVENEVRWRMYYGGIKYVVDFVKCSFSIS